METILSKLTKEDLIKVIANMHDSIQEWNDGLGIPVYEANTLNKIGSVCVEVCIKTKDFNLPNIEATNDISSSLNDMWLSKLEYANKHNLVAFNFNFENKTYLSEWRNLKWSEPHEITEL